VNIPTAARVRENYLSVKERVTEATKRSLRSEAEVSIVGVTKYFDATVAGWLYEAGCRDMGESRPQMLWDKSAAMADREVRWHMIGHVQRNKVKRTLPLLQTMHSLDSQRLLDQIVTDVGDRPEPLQLLLEVNISGEPDKTGILVADAELLLERWTKRSEPNNNLEIAGLMGMGSLSGGADQARCEFESLRLLRERWSIRFGMPLQELSMGMSNDFEIAIEQGATMVRIGSVLFQ